MTSPGKLSLLYRAAWRHARGHPWQSWLGFLGIALGVMMVVAVDLASSSARRAFALSVDTVSGNLTHQIVGGSTGVPDAVFTALRTELGLRRSAPSLTASVRVAGRELTLIGLDLVSEASLARQRPGFTTDLSTLRALGLAALAGPDGVLMSAATAGDLGLSEGDTFALQSGARNARAQLAATFASTDVVATEALVFADIAVAQHLLGRNTLDSIDLVLDDTEAERLGAWLPPGLSLVEAGTRSAALEQMTNAFHTNLFAMSLLALLVAGLMIYNTVTLAVLQRQHTFGILRSLGVSRVELIRLVLTEALVLGLAASGAGLLGGLVLGQGLVQLVTRTIDDLYFDLSVTRFLLDPLVLAKGLAWGTLLTLLSALLPAWQAGRSEPVSLQQREVRDAHWRQRLPLLAAGGALLLLGGYLMLLPERGSLAAGFVALNLIIFGFCLLLPLCMDTLLRLVLLLGGTRLRQLPRLALRNLQRGIARTGLAVAALTVAVSVTVGVGIMVGSFRDTVILWLEQTLDGDVQLTRLDGAAVPPPLLAEVSALPGIERGYQSYQVEAESNFGPVRVGATSASLTDTLYLKDFAESGTAALAAGAGVLVSEPFAWLHGLAPGASIALDTPQGELQLPVLGIFYDYSTGPGMVALAESLLHRYWPEQGASRLTFQLDPGADVGAFTTALRRLAGAYPGTYGVAANADIRRITLAIFDRTFTITHVLRLLSIVVAFVGVLSALIALQLAGLREYATLRAAGVTTGEVATMIGVQTLAMGLLAGLFALPLGLMMSDILIDVINRRSFGWSMLHSVPLGVLGEALLLAVAAALLAGLYPALRVARVQPAEALRGE